MRNKSLEHFTQGNSTKPKTPLLILFKLQRDIYQTQIQFFTDTVLHTIFWANMLEIIGHETM